MTTTWPTAQRRTRTRYVNVDLDIYAVTPLDGLVQALGDEVIVLYVGGRRRKYEAHLELAWSDRHTSADDAICALITLIRGLPRTTRTIWNLATRREFNIGIEAGLEPHGFELRLQQRTLQAIADQGGTVVITVYAPEPRQAVPATGLKKRSKRR